MWWRAALFVVVLVPGCWYVSLAVHEGGHALAASITGAERITVTIPVFGFSHTSRDHDDHALVTTVSGFVAGTTIPLMVWFLAEWWGLRSARVLQGWAGFALVLNGSYCAADVFLRGGDSGQLIRLGTPAAVLVVPGALAVATGLWVWHRMDRTRPAGAADYTAAVALAVIGVVCALVW